MDGPQLNPERREWQQTSGQEERPESPSVSPEEAAQSTGRFLGRSLVRRVERLKLLMRSMLVAELLLALALCVGLALSISLLFILHFTPGPYLSWMVTLAALGLGLFAYVRWIFLKRRRHLSNLAMSAWIEQAVPGLRDRLITAVELSEGLPLVTGGTVATLYEPAILSQFFQEAERRIRNAFLPRVLVRKRLLLILGALVGMFWLYQNSHHFTVYTASDLRGIYLDSHRALWREQKITLAVEPGNLTIVRGEDAQIRAYHIGPGPKPKIELYFRSEQQPWESAPMEKGQQGDDEFRFQRLTQPLDYFATDGKTKTETYLISLVDPPELASLRVKLAFPAYSGLGIRIGQEGEGAIEALPETTVEVVAQFRHEVEKTVLHIGTGEPGPDSEAAQVLGMTETSGAWTGRFTVKQDGWYRLIAESPEGYSTGDALTYSISVLEDQKPFIRIIEPDGWIDFVRTDRFPEIRQGIKPRVPIRYECRDDFGVARVELHFDQEGGLTGRQVLAEYGYGQKEAGGLYRWDVERFWGGAPVTYFLRAYDHPGDRQEKREGRTERFSDSGKLQLFWGRDLPPPVGEEKQPELVSMTDDSEDQADRDGDRKKQPGSGDDRSEALSQLADRMEQLRQQQQNLNRQVEESGMGRPGSQLEESGHRARSAEQQQQIADEIRRLRRDLESEANEMEQQQRSPSRLPDGQQEARETTSQGERSAEYQNPDDPEGRQMEVSPDGAKIGPVGPGDPSGRGLESGPEPGPRPDPAQLREIAQSLDEQRIEQTEQGFQSRTGLEGEMRINRQRLERGQWEEAGKEGRKIEQEMALLEQQMKRMADEPGAGTTPDDDKRMDGIGVGERQEQRASAAGRAKEITARHGETGLMPGGPGIGDEESGEMHGGGLMQGGEGLGSAPFDEYRPSPWNPPELRALGPKAARLGEFLEVDPDIDPFGSAPADERYPFKYEGLVESYFESLVEVYQ